MDYEAYRQAHFVEPAPQPRFGLAGLHGFALFVRDYEAAIAYYTTVLGPPAYVEGESTQGWQIGTSWLTLFPSESGNPDNVEVHILMATPAEADRLHGAFIAAGGTGEPPSDQLMYEPIRYCAVRDPFGTNLLIVARLPR